MKPGAGAAGWARMAERPELEYPTFMGLPVGTVGDLRPGQVCVLGASEATPYDAGEASHSAGAPGAIRAASKLFAGQLRQHDFDLGRTLLEHGREPDWLGVDIGDVKTRGADAAGNRERIAATVERVLAAGAFPLVLGGDDSVPIPVLAGYDGFGPVTVVQIDAHVDWGDMIRGEPNGYGSPMRRVSEMPWITGMLQVGIRGLGSGEAWQHEDARRWGDRIVTAREWRREAEAVRTSATSSRSTATALSRRCSRRWRCRPRAGCPMPTASTCCTASPRGAGSSG